MSGSLWGSPPRMRGKEEDHHQRPGGGRITPAHAGKSQFPGPSPALPRDHPRACGEKTFKTYELDVSRGSPPRMRGKASGQHGADFAAGITPAYAGKSWLPESQSQPSRDHPRVCGEKAQLPQWSLNRLGSPPRMRGKACCWPSLPRRDRITPAYAGKSLFRPRRRPAAWDHPRVCGEKKKSGGSITSKTGSPPRMRGKGRRSSA